MALLRLENVVHRYRERRTGRAIEALRVHELSVAPGEVLAIVGANGSGKSTLLEMMAHLQRPTEGRVLVDGRDLWADRAGLLGRRRAPMLLQKTVLFATNVLTNVLFSLRAHGFGRKEARRRAVEALRQVGMDELAHRWHNELSGGQRRRVALARILALQSDLILLDEPTAGLDRRSERVIEQLIYDISRREGKTVVLASHNYRQAAALATRIVTMVGGRTLAGQMDNVFTGTLTKTQDAFEFAGDRGITLSLRPEHIVEDQWLGLCPREGACTISIAANGFDLVDAGRADLAGEVDVVKTDNGACRVRVRLNNRATVHVEMPLERYHAMHVNLGKQLLALRPDSVRVLPES